MASVSVPPETYPIERAQFRVLGRIASDARAKALREEVRVCLGMLLSGTHLKLTEIAETLGVQCTPGPKEGRSLSFQQLTDHLLPRIRQVHNLEIPGVPKFVRRQMHSQKFAINEGRETTEELVPRTQLLFQLLRQLHISIEGTAIHQDAPAEEKGRYQLITVPKVGRSFYVSDAPDASLYVVHLSRNPERLARLAPPHLECLEKLGVVQRMEEKGIVSWELKMVPLVLTNSTAREYPYDHQLSHEELETEVRLAGVESARHYSVVRNAREERGVNVPYWPNDPEKRFKARGEWNGWYEFLGEIPPAELLTYAELVQEIQSFAFTSMDEYVAESEKHSSWPVNPHLVYPDEWVNAFTFLGKTKAPKKLSYRTLKEKVRAAKITTWSEYSEARKNNPKWPADPSQYFRGKGWRDAIGFFGLERPLSFNRLKEEVKAAGVTDSRTYYATYPDKKGWPADPSKMFANQWIDWYDFCDQPRPIRNYNELKKQAQGAGITSCKQYEAEYANYPGWRARPDVAFKKEWKGWHSFLHDPTPDTPAQETLATQSESV